MAAAVDPQINLEKVLPKGHAYAHRARQRQVCYKAPLAPAPLPWARHEVAGTVPPSHKAQRLCRSLLVLRAQQMGPSEAVLHLRRGWAKCCAKNAHSVVLFTSKWPMNSRRDAPTGAASGGQKGSPPNASWKGTKQTQDKSAGPVPSAVSASVDSGLGP